MYKRNLILFLCMFFLQTNFLNAEIIEMELNNNLVVESNKKSTQMYQDTILVDSAEVSSSEEAVYLPFTKSVSWKVTGAVTAINPTEILKYDNVTDVDGLLSGRVPGLTGGINLRGMGNALVIIDGIPRSIASVRAEEIEQITVLKDISAAVLYGVKARNGVILITTRKGKADRKESKITVEQGFSKPVRLPTYLNSADYKELYNEALFNDELPELYSQDEIEQTRSGLNPVKYPDANYYNSEFLKDYKPWTRVAAEFSGGKENVQYYVNTGVQESGSLINMGEGSDLKDWRLNIRSNLDFKINDFIKSYLNIAAVYDISKSANGNYWSDASTMRPNLYAPLIDTALVTGKEFLSSAKLINGKYVLGGSSTYLNNVWGNLNLAGRNTQFSTEVQFSNGIEIDLKSIAKGLKFNTFISIDSYNRFLETQSNTYAIYEPVWTTDGLGVEQLSLTKRGVDKFDGTQGVSNPVVIRNFGFYGVMDYNRVFGDKHAISASVMAFVNKSNQTALAQSDRTTHLGGTFNYIYNNKYILDFSSALVSSAKLPSSNRIGFSPSLSAGWLVSREDFLKNSSVIDFLKVRASVGSLKSDLTIPSYYLYEQTYNETGFMTWANALMQLRAIETQVEANSNFFYEVRKEANLGIEALLFKSLGVDLNVFYESISDLVLQRRTAYPEYLGGILPYENYGENRYKGIELGLNWDKQVTSNFRFDIGATLTLLQTEVFKIDENYQYSYMYRAGNPISTIFGLEALGLFQDYDDIDNHIPEQTFGEVQPGDIKYKDQNLDGKIDLLDEVPIGKYTPDFFGSLSLRLQFKALTLFALATASGGDNGISNNSYYWVYGDRKYSETVLNRWTAETAETATYPRLSSGGNSNNFRTSTYWLYDNSRINISRLQLTYNITKPVLGTKDLSVFLRASNVATFSKNRDKLELNVGAEPQYRALSLGIKVLF